MLAYLHGLIKDRQAGEMIVLVGSESQGQVGYQVKTPDHPRYETIIPGERAEVYIYTHVREDALDLYGFLSPTEKNFFMTLLSVSGVGPKSALAILSHSDEATLIDLIMSEEKAALTSIPGIGKKTAERMVLELKDTIAKKLESGVLKAHGYGSSKVNEPAGASRGPGIDRGSKLFIEAYLALQGLGYKELQAKQMVEAALKKEQKIEKVEDVIKFALQGSFV